MSRDQVNRGGREKGLNPVEQKLGTSCGISRGDWPRITSFYVDEFVPAVDIRLLGTWTDKESLFQLTSSNPDWRDFWKKTDTIL